MARRCDESSAMNFFNPVQFKHEPDPPRAIPAPETPPRDWKRLALVIGLGLLSWVATYVGMLELIEANMGELPLVHKAIIGFSVAMLMTMIVWLLDRIFAPGDAFTKACYVAGYLFLSVISVGFGFGFYWKVLESRGEASRSAESAITQVQTSLYAAVTRLEQLQTTLDQLTTISTQKADIERRTGQSCPNSGPGDGPRRKMRDEDAERFKFAADFVKGRVTGVKNDMSGLDADLQKIVKDDKSVIDPKTGTRNDFLRGIGRKLDFTVAGFNAFRSDPQLKQIRSDLSERAETTTLTGSKGTTLHCPDPQLQMALRGVVRAIDQLPELEKPKIAAVEGSEATIEAFRRLTTTFVGVLSFKLPPSADELRELQKKAMQSVEMSGEAKSRAPVLEQAGGLAKRDYVPLAVAIFVDLCLLLVSIGRPMNRFVGMQLAIREAERGPIYPILSRFYDIHADERRVKIFEVFREVIFDLNGQYHVAVPLNVPRYAENREELRREAQHLANVCYALEGRGILLRPRSFLPALMAPRELTRRGSKFIECYGDTRAAARLRKHEKPAFKVYRFQKGAWQEMILGAVMGAAHVAESERGRHPLRVPSLDEEAWDLPLSGSWSTHSHASEFSHRDGLTPHPPVDAPREHRSAGDEAAIRAHEAHLQRPATPPQASTYQRQTFFDPHSDVGARSDHQENREEVLQPALQGIEIANSNTAPSRENSALPPTHLTIADDRASSNPSEALVNRSENAIGEVPEEGSPGLHHDAPQNHAPAPEAIAIDEISGWFARDKKIR